MITSYGLATLNALLNSSAFVCVVLGYRAIKQGNIALHKRFMLSAFTLSVLFLTSYGTRILMFGDTRFLGQGLVRPLYFFILISHVGLAVLIAPFVIYTVYLGLSDKREQHRKVAPRVLPVWSYVLCTGVLVYLFLYQWFPHS